MALILRIIPWLFLWTLTWNIAENFQSKSFDVFRGQRVSGATGFQRLFGVNSQRQCAHVCLLQVNGTCMAANYAASLKICDILPDDENKTIVQDQDWTFIQVVNEASCTRWKDNRGRTTSGTYTLDPDGMGGVPSFDVFCDMSTTPPIARVQHNASDVRTHVVGYERNYYVHAISFTGYLPSQLRLLTETSTSCQQFIKKECYHSLTVGWSTVTSREGEILYYFAGNGSEVTSGCACAFFNNTCAGGHLCNCNENDYVWRSDEGYLTHKTVLPIAQITVGDTAGTDEEAYITVGDLECVD